MRCVSALYLRPEVSEQIAYLGFVFFCCPNMRRAALLLSVAAAALQRPESSSALIAPTAEDDTEEWKKLMALSPADLEEELKAAATTVKESQDTAVQDMPPSESPSPSSNAPQTDDGSWTGDLGLPADGEFDDGQWHGDQQAQREREQPPLPVVRVSAPHDAQSEQVAANNDPIPTPIATVVDGSCVAAGAECCLTSTGMPFCAGAFVCTGGHCANPASWEAEEPEKPMDWVCNKPEKWCAGQHATNVHKMCAGVPGHFCQDASSGLSGFQPCDEKLKSTWGTVECVETAKPAKSPADRAAAAADRAAAAAENGAEAAAAVAAEWDAAAAAAAAPPATDASCVSISLAANDYWCQTMCVTEGECPEALCECGGEQRSASPLEPAPLTTPPTPTPSTAAAPSSPLPTTSTTPATPSPAPEEKKNRGAECWSACGNKPGKCFDQATGEGFCGEPGVWSGSCCMFFAEGKQQSPDCGSRGCSEHHCCVEDVPEGRAQGRAPLPSPAAVPSTAAAPAGKTPASNLSSWASVERLTELFLNAQPDSSLTRAGVMVHNFDLTESLQQPWRPCDGEDNICEGDNAHQRDPACETCPLQQQRHINKNLARRPPIPLNTALLTPQQEPPTTSAQQWEQPKVSSQQWCEQNCAERNWWSTSIINHKQRNAFADSGIILDPDRVQMLCSYPYDSGTMERGCDGVDNMFGAGELKEMMEMSMYARDMLRKGLYNEVLIDSRNFTAALPGSIAAFVFNLNGINADMYGRKTEAYERYIRFLDYYNLDETDVPLLRAAMWGGTEGKNEPIFTDVSLHARQYLKEMHVRARRADENKASVGAQESSPSAALPISSSASSPSTARPSSGSDPSAANDWVYRLSAAGDSANPSTANPSSANDWVYPQQRDAANWNPSATNLARIAQPRRRAFRAGAKEYTPTPEVQAELDRYAARRPRRTKQSVALHGEAAKAFLPVALLQPKPAAGFVAPLDGSLSELMTKPTGRNVSAEGKTNSSESNQQGVASAGRADLIAAWRRTGRSI